MEREELKVSERTRVEREGMTRMLTSKQRKHMHMTERMLQFFKYEHLRSDLQGVSRPFSQLANLLCDTLPSNAERTVALRKLLESKDCAVRAYLYEDPSPNQGKPSPDVVSRKLPDQTITKQTDEQKQNDKDLL